MNYSKCKAAWKNAFRLATVLLLASSTSVAAKEVVLKGGTPITVQLGTTISGGSVSVGQVIDCKVTRDIQVDGVTVIPAGSLAKAQVVRAKKNGILGKEGQLQISINSVTAVDGTQVMLSGGTLSDEGSDKLVLSLFLCFLIKGGAAELPAGMECTPLVSGNTVINVS